MYIALQASKSLLPAPGFQAPDFRSLSRHWDQLVTAEGDARRKILPFGVTTIALGHDDAEADDSDAPYDPAHEFGWDVENPRREVSVPAFKIAALPVSNGEYLEWLQSAEGVSTPDLVPCSWAQVSASSSDFRVKTLYGEVPFAYAKHWPVSASAVQLQAYAKVSNLFSRLANILNKAPLVQGWSPPDVRRDGRLSAAVARRQRDGKHRFPQLAPSPAHTSPLSARWTGWIRQRRRCLDVDVRRPRRSPGLRAFVRSLS